MLSSTIESNPLRDKLTDEQDGLFFPSTSTNTVQSHGDLNALLGFRYLGSALYRARLIMLVAVAVQRFMYGSKPPAGSLENADLANSARSSLEDG